jgi:N-acetylglucosaminyldiphosphoundecaprenol N-acetyl-beta-D-mannosaminyltransferase
MSNRTTTPSLPETKPMISLMGLRLACIDRRGLVDHMFASLETGRGGWIITANLDFLRRYVCDSEARMLYDAAEIRVADGMPLVWACWVQGDKLPERVPGSSLVWPVIERAAQKGRSVYLLGGAPGASGRAAKVLVDKYPSLKLCGSSSPVIESPPSSRDLELVLSEVERARPDILFVGLGSPKQEQLIRFLREHLPSTWMVGVGISFSFIAGDLKRAPAWMRKMGIEWVHRMMQDPGRLTKRYLVDDLPFALRLFPHALRVRLQRAYARG